MDEVLVVVWRDPWARLGFGLVVGFIFVDRLLDGGDDQRRDTGEVLSIKTGLDDSLIEMLIEMNRQNVLRIERLERLLEQKVHDEVS